MSHPFRAEASASVAEAFEHWGEAVVFTPAAGGDAIATRAIDRTADVIAFTPRARQMARTLDLPREAIATRPRKGDTVVAGGLTYTVAENAVSDDALGLVWTCRVTLTIGRTASLAFILAPPLCVATVGISTPIALPAPTVWATVFVPVTASVAAQLSAPSVVATAVRTSGRAVGLDAVLPPPALSAAATVEALASADIMLSAPSTSFAALLAASVGNAVTLPAPVAISDARVTAGAFLSLTLPAPTVESSATAANAAEMAVTLPTPEVSATVLLSSGRVADLALTLPTPAVSAAALSTVSGSLAATLPAPSVSAEALVGVLPYAGVTLPGPAVVAAATAGDNAALALTLPMPTVSAAALLSIATINAYTLAAPGVSATATVATGASHTPTLPTPSVSAAATLTLAPAVAFNVPRPSVSATALLLAAGALSFTLPIPSLTATATVVSASSAPVVESATWVEGTTSVSATKPTGTASGNLLLLFVQGYTSNPNTPSGFTAGPTFDSGNHHGRIAVFWKIAGGSEGSSYTVSVPSGNLAVSLLRISGAAASSPIESSTGTGAANSGTRQAASLTTTVANTRLLMYSNGDNQSTSTPSGMTDVTAAGDPWIKVFSEARAATGATGTRSHTQSSALWAALMIAIKPA